MKGLVYCIGALKNLMYGKYIDLRIPLLYGDTTFYDLSKLLITQIAKIPITEVLVSLIYSNIISRDIES